MLDVSFLNKNMYRKYPLRSTSTYTSIEGVTLPLTIFTAMRVTTKLGLSDLYISKLYIKGNYINITLTNSSGIAVGVFSGILSKDFQTITLRSVDPAVSGFITLGILETFSSLDGVYTFTYTEGKLEDSVIVCVPIPTVTGILIKGKKLTGEITLKLDNLTADVEDGLLVLDVVDETLVASNYDKNSGLLNCTTNVISGINGVMPDAQGNIILRGILPVQVRVDGGDISLDTPGLGFTEVCQNVKTNIPPVPGNPDVYQDNFLTTTQEEWKTWPQYND